MIVAESLTKSFGGREAVSSLSFSTLKGEIFGIVGPDGAGKSTLLRMAAAILRPDSGNLSIDGMDVSGNPYSIKERLAYMPQRFGLYEDLTVEENIYFFGRLFGRSKRQIRAGLDRLYGFSRLGPFRDRLAGKLSGGMKQKLGLACCLVHAPDLILLDEPTNGVDPVSRREFWKILYDLLSDGVTILVSTAYLDEAERCNRIALMYRGRFITSGYPSDIKESIGKRFMEMKTSNPIMSEMELRKKPEYKGIILTGETLRLFVSDVEDSKRKIKKILTGAGIKTISMTEKTPTLEDCFVHIVAEEK